MNEEDNEATNFLLAHEAFFKTNVPKESWKCLIKLGEEVGEVSEAGLALLGSESKTRKIRKSGQEPIERMTEELGDVLVVAMNVARAFGISPQSVFGNAATKMIKRMK